MNRKIKPQALSHTTKACGRVMELGKTYDILHKCNGCGEEFYWSMLESWYTDEPNNIMLDGLLMVQYQICPKCGGPKSNINKVEPEVRKPHISGTWIEDIKEEPEEPESEKVTPKPEKVKKVKSVVEEKVFESKEIPKPKRKYTKRSESWKKKNTSSTD